MESDRERRGALPAVPLAMSSRRSRALAPQFRLLPRRHCRRLPYPDATGNRRDARLTIAHVFLGSELRFYETEAGEIPARSRHCNRPMRFGVRLKVRPLVISTSRPGRAIRGGFTDDNGFVGVMTATRASVRRQRARPVSLRLWILGIVFFGASSIPAWAHREATGRSAPADSISIPNLSHGQMAVIADNRAAILGLAARQIPTDPTMRRLEGFINLQFFDCMWGMVPGSVEDESSPFNECSHAYLAAGASDALVNHAG